MFNKYASLDVYAPPPHRHEGLDLARFIAFVGMVFINFKVVMIADFDPNHAGISDLIEGRAAALFVVLAGVGLGLSVQHANNQQTIGLVFRRASFLFVIGIMNTAIFEADILHYYAFYFLIGALCLSLSAQLLTGLIFLINTLFVMCVFLWDYDKGWDWSELSYQDFWTLPGFVRSLVFNGFHPILPWVSFLIFGILLSRLDLNSRTLQNRLIWLGLISYGLSELLSRALKSTISEDFWFLVETVPIPPMPLYILSGMGSAIFIIGLCLRFTPFFYKTGLLKWVMPAGRQTLTLYIAHIIIGMGILESLNMLGGQSLRDTVIATIFFCGAATLFALLWSVKYKRGPIETLMRKWAG